MSKQEIFEFLKESLTIQIIIDRHYGDGCYDSNCIDVSASLFLKDPETQKVVKISESSENCNIEL